MGLPVGERGSSEASWVVGFVEPGDALGMEKEPTRAKIAAVCCGSNHLTIFISVRTFVYLTLNTFQLKDLTAGLVILFCITMNATHHVKSTNGSQHKQRCLTMKRRIISTIQNEHMVP